MRDWKIHEEKK